MAQKTHGVDFINIFLSSFYTHRSQKCKKNIDELIVFFALLGSAHAKAANRMMMKLTPGKGCETLRSRAAVANHILFCHHNGGKCGTRGFAVPTIVENWEKYSIFTMKSLWSLFLNGNYFFEINLICRGKGGPQQCQFLYKKNQNYKTLQLCLYMSRSERSNTSSNYVKKLKIWLGQQFYLYKVAHRSRFEPPLPIKVFLKVSFQLWEYFPHSHFRS